MSSWVASSSLEVIYLIFNEGYSATAGDDWVRPAWCEDALRLGRILAELTEGGNGFYSVAGLAGSDCSQGFRDSQLRADNRNRKDGTRQARSGVFVPRCA